MTPISNKLLRLINLEGIYDRPYKISKALKTRTTIFDLMLPGLPGELAYGCVIDFLRIDGLLNKKLKNNIKRHKCHDTDQRKDCRKPDDV